MGSSKDHNIIIRKFYTEHPANSPYYVHTNDGHEIYLLLKGDVSFSIDGKLYKMKPYDMLIISNKEIHRTIINSDIPHERIYIYFNPNTIAPFNTCSCNLLHIFENRSPGYGNRIAQEYVTENGLPEYFRQIYEWCQSDLPERNVMMLTLLIQLIVKASGILSSNKTEPPLKMDANYSSKIYPILDYIASNLQQKITLDELSAKFYIDKYYLCHLFKKKTSFTVQEYILYKRISAAKEQLIKGCPVNTVCANVGFDDYSNFYRIFKRIVKMSPSDYVRRHRTTP